MEKTEWLELLERLRRYLSDLADAFASALTETDYKPWVSGPERHVMDAHHLSRELCEMRSAIEWLRVEGSVARPHRQLLQISDDVLNIVAVAQPVIDRMCTHYLADPVPLVGHDVAVEELREIWCRLRPLTDNVLRRADELVP